MCETTVFRRIMDSTGLWFLKERTCNMSPGVAWLPAQKSTADHGTRSLRFQAKQWSPFQGPEKVDVPVQANSPLFHLFAPFRPSTYWVMPTCTGEGDRSSGPRIIPSVDSSMPVVVLVVSQDEYITSYSLHISSASSLLPVLKKTYWKWIVIL